MRLKLLLAVCMALFSLSTFAQYKTVSDIPYLTGNDVSAYRAGRCKLDVYYPESAQKPFKTIVWIHGGALMYLQKEIPEPLMGRDVAVVGINYSLYPQAKCPDFLDDAAAAVAWTFSHIAEYGGDPGEIYVAGHSAGGYIVLMLALDKSYLGKYGIDADAIKGYYPIGGQTAVPMAVCQEMGLPTNDPVVNEFAPLSHVRKLGTPLVLITGDRRTEQPRRFEENLYLKGALEAYGNAEIPFYEMAGFEHGEAHQPGCLLVYKLITGNSVSTHRF